MAKVLNSNDAARELGLSPLYASRFFKAHGIEKVCGVYMITEQQLAMLKRQRAGYAAERKHPKRGAA